MYSKYHPAPEPINNKPSCCIGCRQRSRGLPFWSRAGHFVSHRLAGISFRPTVPFGRILPKQAFSYSHQEQVQCQKTSSSPVCSGLTPVSGLRSTIDIPIKRFLFYLLLEPFRIRTLQFTKQFHQFSPRAQVHYQKTFPLPSGVV